MVESTSKDPKVGLVVSGDIARRHGVLDGATPAVIMICASEHDLAAQDIPIAERTLPEHPEILLNPDRQMIDDLVTQNHLGRASLAVAPGQATDAQELTVVALTKPGIQGQGILVLTGDEDEAREIAQQVRGWVAVATNPNVVHQDHEHSVTTFVTTGPF